MKKHLMLVVLALTFGLTGCFGSDTPAPSEEATGYHSYGTEEFRLDIPDSWEVLTPVNFTSDIPAQTVVAFRNNIKNPRFTANVAILKNTLSGEVTTLDYAKALAEKLRTELVGFREISIEESVIKVGGVDAATLFLFTEGRETPEADIKRFMHTAGVKGTNAYIIVGGFLVSEEQAAVAQIEKMVRSFEVR